VVFRPIPAVTTFVYAGKEMVDAKYWNFTAAGKAYGFGYGDYLGANSTCGVEGGATATCSINTSQIQSATLGGWWKYYAGPLGNAQVGITDTYIKREVFSAAAGGDPSTNINIVMVSFRYYPFQK
jgi:hypothetical protein